MKKIYTLLFLFLATSTQAQTTINTGDVSGTWNKAGSPYLINGHIEVPLGKSLIITEGVTIEFQGAYMLNVYGHINVLGKEKDTVLFTPKDKNIGWQGIHIHKNTTDTFKFEYGKFEYVKYFELSFAKKHGAIRLDTVYNSLIINCVFDHNITNLGGGVMGYRSNLNIYNSIFSNNRTVDTLINSILESSGVAAVNISRSKLLMKNCLFNNNISSSYILLMSLSKGMDIYNCKFINNKCLGNFDNSNPKTLIKIHNLSGYNSKSKFYFKSCQFIDNYIKSSSTLQIGNKSADRITITINNCNFIKNMNDDKRSPSNISIYGINGNNNTVLINNSFFKNNNSPSKRGITIVKTNHLNTIENCIIEGNQTTAVSMEGEIKNCLIANNAGGVDFSTDDSRNKIINSTIVNNENFGVRLFGATQVANSKVELYNNIISGNRDTLNRWTNLYSSQATYTKVHNNIIEGGRDSSWTFDRSKQDIVHKAKFGTYTNNIDQAPIFEKPSKGVGPAFYDSTADWHLKNTCTQIPLGYNKGTTDIRDANNQLIAMPKYDLDGNPRIQGGQIDIGPYEMAGLKSEVSVYKQPKDTAACPNNTVNFDATVLGIALNYQWQQSTDKNTWSNINLANKPSLDTKNATTNYYRLVATQKECKKADTTDAAKLSIHALPTPNLGADKDLKDNATLKLDAGTFSTYKWNNNKTSQTITLDGSTMALGKALFWVEVTNTKGCKGADSIVITVKKSDGLFDVQTLPNINIYPNPAGHSIQLAGNLAYPMDIKIVNLNGQTLLNKALNNAQAIDISALDQGIYTLISTNKNGAFSAKLVVE